MRYIQKNKILEDCIWLLTVALLAEFVIFAQSTYGSMIFLAVTVTILIFDAIQGAGRITFKVESFHIHVFLFALFCYASSLWAWLPSKAIEKGTTIMEVLICMSVLYIHYSKKDTVMPLVDAVMWSGYVITIYTFLFTGLTNIRIIMSSGDRLLYSFANINTIGFAAAMSLTLTVHNILFVTKRLRLKHLFIIPVLIMVAISGSRKTLVFAALGIVFLVMLRYQSRNMVKTVLRWGTLAVLIVVVFTLLLSLPMFETVKERMVGLIAAFTGKGEVDSSSIKRMRYIQIGLEQFKQNPFLGIGIGSSGELLSRHVGINTYLHNNFVELLACGGLLGFFCFYSIYIHLLIRFFLLRKNSDICFPALIVLLVLLLAMDYGMVSYYSKETYFYLMIFFLEERILQRGRRRKL